MRNQLVGKPRWIMPLLALVLAATAQAASAQARGEAIPGSRPWITNSRYWFRSIKKWPMTRRR